ncbi:hypothetical protein [Nannocystis radixulma]|uniref:Uncharacterized protein n=1 Tax=Nannocystis radixulma TaxID=2995305 RepID=A0ABT5BAB2_9BACT|nr:hypothetical protein [Nannocystis radixulma]MDC0670668.1 hypothetical protein [Nannocystis radixulma]
MSDSSHKSSDPPLLAEPPILPALEDAAPLYRLSAPQQPLPRKNGPLISSVPLADPATAATAPHGDETAADDTASSSESPAQEAPHEPDVLPPSPPPRLDPPLAAAAPTPAQSTPTIPAPAPAPITPAQWIPPHRPYPSVAGTPIPPITNPYPRPFIPPGTLAAVGLMHRPGSANAVSASSAPAPEPAPHDPVIAAPEPAPPPVTHPDPTALPDLGLLAAPEPPHEFRTSEAPALVPELDVLLRDTTIPSPRRREGSAPLMAARREPSSTHAVPTLLARREPSSAAQSAPALVPALDALEFDPPNGQRPRRPLPNLIPEPGAPVTLLLDRPAVEAPPRRALPNLIPEPGAPLPRVLVDPPRRDLVGAPAASESPVPKNSSQSPPVSPPPAALHNVPTDLPIGLAVTQPAAVNPAPAPVFPSSDPVPLPRLPTIRVATHPRERWLWVGVVLAALAFLGAVVSRLNRNSEPTPELADVAEESSVPPAPVEPPPTEPPSQPPPAPTPPPAVIPEPEPPAPANVITCPDESTDDPAIGLIVNPFTPIAGAPLRIFAATLADDVPLSLHILADDDEPLATQSRLGLPSSATATWTPDAAGEYTIAVAHDGVAIACRKVQVVSTPPERPPFAPKGRAWPVERAWTPAEEALYSAWLRELFAAPRGDAAGFARLDQATGDPARNLLHDALGLREDDLDQAVALRLKPDGADLPYVVRAYWSWKRRLPFAYRKCQRGGDGQAPRCGDARTNLDPGPGFTMPATELARVQRFLFRNVGWGVHAGNARTALGDSSADLYPVRLDLRGLRPGAVYTDPHGHVFLVVDLLPAEGDERGTLLAVDGNPDGSIARRRFWEGAFLWDPDPAHGGTGFKRFRPVVRRDGGRLVQSSDAEILESADLGDIWTGHAELPGVSFYDAVVALVDAPPWDPSQIQREFVAALAELARDRVEPVARGAEYARGRKRPITMPRGWEVFEATGAWESYSTPGRDLRLLIALDVVRRLPDRVRERPNLYVTGGDPEARATALTDELAALLRDPQHAITYTRSDGTPWTVTLHDLVDRETALERAYNPNDCPELRWGAPEGSDELTTCSFRAPADQHARMEAYRAWLHQRRPPKRGDKSP